jgi:hypothetical protein
VVWAVGPATQALYTAVLHLDPQGAAFFELKLGVGGVVYYTGLALQPLVLCKFRSKK